ncbi:MAG: hypothetical protein KJ792_02985 [Actinobacteria bacterium]|nr:hypothetical protein [Actinomycetota bacterium]
MSDQDACDYGPAIESGWECDEQRWEVRGLLGSGQIWGRRSACGRHLGWAVSGYAQNPGERASVVRR